MPHSGAAPFGDGWYGFNLEMVAVWARIAAPAGDCRQRGHSLAGLTVAVALSDGHPGLLAELAETGVTELVLVAAKPDDPAAAT